MAELDDKVIVTKNLITDVADAIREEMDESDTYTLPTMVEKVHTLGQGGGGSADVKRLGITLANNTATFNLNGYEIWQLIGSNKTIVADITYTDGNNSTSYNKSCTASLKSEASDTQTRIEASVVIYKNYTFYTRYFNMVIGASSMEYTGTYAVTDIVIPEEQYVDPLFTLTYPSTITCNKTFAQISSYYGAGNTKPVAPQLIYKYSSDDDTAFRSVYGEVEQYDEDTYIFTFNMGYARGVGKTQWQERIIEIQYERGDSLSKIDDYIFEYQKPVVAGDGIELENVGTGNNRKSKISVDSSMIMIGNASGSVASFIDGGNDIPLKSCIVSIEPLQSGSGDPSPQNVRPISGWTECNITKIRKNFFDKTTCTTKRFLSSSGSINTSDNWSISDYIQIKNNASYILSGVTNAGDVAYHCFYDKSKNFISSIVSTTQNFTTPTNAYYVRLSMRTETPDSVQFELGSTATEFAPYVAPTTYNIEFPSEAGTVYGGTLDVTNGVLTVDRAMVDLTTLNFSYSSQYSLWLSQITLSQAKVMANTTPINGICDSFIISKASGTLPVNSLTVNTSKTVFIDNNSNVDVPTGNLCYELETPQTYNLTPTEIKTLLGINNIFADTGDIENVEYTRDATSIINWLISQINLGA